MAIILAATSTFSLEVPYLISATAAGDTGVELSWRNNDASSTGYRVLRKDTTAAAYKLIDSVKSATQLSFLDNAGLKPSKLYTYQVEAYDASAVSDTSNSIQVTMPAAPIVPDTFVAAGISVVWNYDTSKSVQIRIANHSNSETGYRIYRSTGFSSPFTLIGQIALSKPESGDTLTFQDSAAALNTWYCYEAAAYKTGDSVFSAACSTFTFRSQKPKQIAKFTKLANCPISDSAGWAAIAGDSIILRESNAPAGKFTAINIANPAAPAFAGYIDSTTLLSYPLQTLVPVYLNYGVKNGYGPAGIQVLLLNNHIVTVQESMARLYQIAGSKLTLLDSFTLSGVSAVLQLNDSLFAIQFTSSQSSGMDYYATYFCLPVKISSNKFFKSDSVVLGSAISGEASGEYTGSYVYNRGMVNSIIFSPVNMIGFGYLNYSDYALIADDIGLNQVYNAHGTSARAFTNNSGYYVSATQFLSPDSINVNAVYAENIMDLNAYQTALANDAVLTDSFSSRQNVLVDTINKRLYIIYKTNMSIFSYAFSPVGVINRASKPLQLPGELRILSSAGQSGITIVFPGAARHADLAFYDLSGRMVDRLTATGSNAVLWRPKTHTSGCCVVSAKIDGETYSARFMVR
jgi:hypothetical protein